MAAVHTAPPLPPLNRTLGPLVEEWMASVLVDGVSGDPLILTNEQSEFLDRYYALTDDGRWRYSRATLRRARGTGKSPFAAYLAAAELAGPVRFSHWDAEGNPVARPAKAPFIQIVGTTLEQGKGILEFVAACWSDEAIERYGLRIGVEQVIKTTGPRGRIKVVGMNPRALRGGRPSLVIVEEASEWVKSNGGHAAWIRVRGNLAKSTDGGRLLTLENAYLPGEDSIGERTHVAWQKQKAKAQQTGNPLFEKILYDSLEASPDIRLNDPASLRQGIREAAGDAVWLDVETLAQEALDPDTPPSQFRREHLNQIIATEDAILSRQEFDRVARPLQLAPRDRVTMGSDISLSDDDTAVVVFRLSDRTFHLVHHQGRDPLEDESTLTSTDPDSRIRWAVDQNLLDDAVNLVISQMDVQAWATDVHPLDELVRGWDRTHRASMKAEARPGHGILCDMRTGRRELTFAFTAMMSEIRRGTVGFAENELVRQHFMNAKLRPNRDGELFGKATRSSPRKVDIVAACLLAYIVAQKIESTPARPAVRVSGRAW